MSAWRIRPAAAEDAAQIVATHDEAWQRSGRDLCRSVMEQPDSFYVLKDASSVVAFLEFGDWGNWRMVEGMEDHDP